MARARGRLNSTGSSTSPTTLNDEGGVTMSRDQAGPMIVTHSKAQATQPTPADIQKMKELEFIRKHPTSTA